MVRPRSPPPPSFPVPWLARSRISLRRNLFRCAVSSCLLFFSLLVRAWREWIRLVFSSFPGGQSPRLVVQTLDPLTERIFIPDLFYSFVIIIVFLFSPLHVPLPSLGLKFCRSYASLPILGGGCAPSTDCRPEASCNLPFLGPRGCIWFIGEHFQYCPSPPALFA